MIMSKIGRIIKLINLEPPLMIINLLNEIYNLTAARFCRKAGVKLLVKEGNLQSFPLSPTVPINCEVCCTNTKKGSHVIPQHRVTGVYVELRDNAKSRIHFGCAIRLLSIERPVHRNPNNSILYIMWDVFRELVQTPCDDVELANIKNKLTLCLYMVIKPIYDQTPKLILMNTTDYQQLSKIIRGENKCYCAHDVFKINLNASRVKCTEAALPGRLPPDKTEQCTAFYIIIQRIYLESPSINTALKIILNVILPDFLNMLEVEDLYQSSTLITHILLHTGPMVSYKLLRPQDIQMLLQLAIDKTAYGIIYELKASHIKIDKSQVIQFVKYIMMANVSDFTGFKHALEYFECIDLLDSDLIINIISTSMNIKNMPTDKQECQTNYIWKGLWVFYDHLEPGNTSSALIYKIIKMHYTHNLLEHYMFQHFFKRFYKQIASAEFSEIVDVINDKLPFNLVYFMARSSLAKDSDPFRLMYILISYNFTTEESQIIFQYLLKYNIIGGRNFVPLFNYFIHQGRYPGVIKEFFGYISGPFIKTGLKEFPNQLVMICNDLDCMEKIAANIVGLCTVKEVHKFNAFSTKCIINYIVANKDFLLADAAAGAFTTKGLIFILNFVLTIQAVITTDNNVCIEYIVCSMLKSPFFNRFVKRTDIDEVYRMLKATFKYEQATSLIKKELCFREN